MNNNEPVKILAMQDRARLIYNILKDRRDILLPQALSVDNLDMWLIFCVKTILILTFPPKPGPFKMRKNRL